MAEPGDPNTPDTSASPAVDHDAEIGFASPESLQGQPRRPVPPDTPIAPPPPVSESGMTPDPEPDPAPEAEPELFALSAERTPDATPLPESSTEPVETPARLVRSAEAQPVRPAASVSAPGPTATPSWAIETPEAQRPYLKAHGPAETPAEVAGAPGLYSVYALILFAVPTLGVSALIALFAVTVKPRPTGATEISHFIFQQRTLWVGAVVALVGIVLIAVGLGVFVLFALAVWFIIRGATGILKLKAGRAIDNPRHWLV